LFFDTPDDWIGVIQTWANETPEISAVWIFGSRVTGLRRRKEVAETVPDLDIAYALMCGEPDAELSIALANQSRWRARLQAAIPVKVDLCWAQTNDAVVWPSVQAHGLCIFDRRS
jgi:predicted nucleotidyltransferase